MRRAAGTLTSLALAAAGALAVSGPAAAANEHYTSMSPDGRCFLGTSDSGLFFDPGPGAVTSYRAKEGVTVRFTCSFRLPEVTRDDYGQVWTRPTETTRSPIQCARPEDGYWGSHRRSVLVVRPSGQATAICYAAAGAWPE